MGKVTSEEETLLGERIIADSIAVLGVHENGHSNAGPYVNIYLAFVGLKPGNPWCCAFAVYRAYTAAQSMNLTLSLPKTGSSSALFRWAEKNNAILPKPRVGCLAVIQGGRTGHKHTCIVERIDGDYVWTIDANDDDMVRRDRHRIASCDFVRLK